MILVGNKNIKDHNEVEHHCIYVGRPSVLGNPYSHKRSKLPDTIYVNTIEEALSSYKRWLWNKIQSKDIPVLNELSRIKYDIERDDVTLMCWCVDENRNGPCHAYIIKVALEWMIK